MVRITAREAYDRRMARLCQPKRQRRNKTDQAIAEMRQIYIQDLANRGLVKSRNQMNQQPTTSRSNQECRNQPNHSSSDTDTMQSRVPGAQSKIKLQTSWARARRPLRTDTNDNKKITDFFTVTSRGRENLIKSPASASRPSPHSPVTNPENQDRQAPFHLDEPRVPLREHTPPTLGNMLSIIRVNQLTKKSPRYPPLNGHEVCDRLDSSARSESDVEIIDILPPIPERAHTVYDIDD